MCGIASYLLSISRGGEAVARMLAVIAHRGPDESSEYHFGDHLGLLEPQQGHLTRDGQRQRIGIARALYHAPRGADHRRGHERAGQPHRAGSDGGGAQPRLPQAHHPHRSPALYSAGERTDISAGEWRVRWAGDIRRVDRSRCIFPCYGYK